MSICYNLRSFGLSIETSKFLNVQLAIAILVKVLEKHTDLAGREVEGMALQDLGGLFQSDEAIAITVILLELGHQCFLTETKRSGKGE